MRSLALRPSTALLALVLASLFVGACSEVPPAGATDPVRSPSASASAPSPSLDTPSAPPTPLPSADGASDSALIAIAVAYANDAGIPWDDGVPPAVVEAEPMFDSTLLHRVSLALAGGDDAMLQVYLDDQGAIRVVEDGNYRRPTATTIAEPAIIEAAERHLQQVGIDPTTGSLHVAAHGAGYWYLTFDREIAGYRVANAPMGWWLDGDKAYLELRADGSLEALYAIRPDAAAAPTILDLPTLNARLAVMAHRTPAELGTYETELLWVRANDQYTKARTLSLSYCATHTFEHGWDAWCVDAGTGEPSAFGGGVD